MVCILYLTRLEYFDKMAESYAFNVAWNGRRGEDSKYGDHGLSRRQIREILNTYIQVPRRRQGITKPLLSVETLYDTAARLGMNYRHPKGERRAPLVDALVNSAALGILLAGAGSIHYVLHRTEHEGNVDDSATTGTNEKPGEWVPGLLDRINQGFVLGFSDREKRILMECYNSNYASIIANYSIAEIDALYREIDVPAFGDQIALCDIDVLWWGGRPTTEFRHPNSIRVRTFTPGAPTEIEILEGAIVAGVDIAETYEYDFKYVRLVRVNSILYVTNDMNYTARAHYGTELLQYVTTTKCFVQPGDIEWKRNLEAPVDMQCGYKLMNEDLDVSIEEVNTIAFGDANRDPNLGLSPDNIIQVFKAKNKTIRIYVLNDAIIVSHVVPAGERTRTSSARSRKTPIYIAMNQHLIRPTDAEHDRLMGLSDEKQSKQNHMDEEDDEEKLVAIDDRSIIHTCPSWEAAIAMAKELHAKNDMPRTICDDFKKREDEMISTFAQQFSLILGQKAQREAKKNHKAELKAFRETMPNLKELQEKYQVNYHKIYVPVASLGYEYDQMVKSGVVYASNRKLCGKVTRIKISDHITIYANEDYEGLKDTASRLAITMYDNENIQAIARCSFEKFRKDPLWRSSTFNNEFAEILAMYPPQALNVTFDTTVDESNEIIRGVDLARAYASQARRGGFFYCGIDSELEYYDAEETHPVGSYMFIVYTNDTLLFNGNGLYTNELVSYGLEWEIITTDNIIKQIRMTPAYENDRLMKEYIDYIYRTVTNEIHRKQIPNMAIGQLPPCKKLSNPESVIVSSMEEAFWYLHNMNKSIKSMSPIGSITADPSREAYHVYGSECSISRTSDALMRHVIIQNSRLETYKLMKRIEAKYPIVAVKTDAVYYKCPKEERFEIPIVPAGTLPFDTIRHEKQHQWENPVMGKQQHMVTDEIQFESHSWKEPLGKLSDKTPFDARRLLDFNRVYIAGFPGSGKTYTLNKLYEIYTSMGKRTVMCAFTHKAARLLRDPSGKTVGVTAHKLFGMALSGDINEKKVKEIMNDIDVIIIDEMSMIPKEIYMILAHIPERVRIIGGGDFAQHKPIEDTKPVPGYYFNTSMFRSLFGYNMVTLRMDHRCINKVANESFRKFFTMAESSSVRAARHLVMPYVKTAGPEDDYPLKNICFTNKRRREVNEAVMARECKSLVRQEDRIRINGCEDEFTHIDVGMPVIADETNYKYEYSNNQTFIVKSIGTREITLEDDIDSSIITTTLERFKRDFRPAYCMTSYKAQGDTIDGPYGIHEFNRIDANGAYVCITRATDPSNIMLFN